MKRSAGGPRTWQRQHGLCSAVLVLVPLSGCGVGLGACPTPDECACPCDDAPDPVCATTGKVYHNLCMLRCDGQTPTACSEAGDAQQADGSRRGAGVDVDTTDDQQPGGGGHQSKTCEERCGGDSGSGMCGEITEAGGTTTYVWYANGCMRRCEGATKAKDEQCR